MNLRISSRRGSLGSVMLMALFICALMGITLGSYLTLVRAQARNVGRSQDWNRALILSEAGVEEALAQLNPGVGPMVDPTANGWGSPSGGFYGPKSRTLSNDSYTVTYTTAASPTIYSTGFVTSASSTLARVIQAQTTNTPLFTVSIGARMNIDMNGNALATDSFDSSKTNLSNNGIYDSSKTSTNGSIASVGGVVNMGNHTIDGNLYLGPTATFAGGNVEGTTYYDFNVDFPDVVLPVPVSSFVNATANAKTINGTSYTYCLSNNNNYSIPTSGNVYVAPGIKATLYVASSMGNIYVDGTGANAGNVQVYVAASTLNTSATSASGVASSIAMWGLPTCTSITLSGNQEFTGTIYAPEASLTLNGGGSSDQDLCGSFVVNTIRINGHFKFHYDEALGSAGPTRGFAVTSWREL